MFKNGEGTEINEDSAEYYYNLAIEKDSSTDAMNSLGVIYQERKEFKIAYEWYQKAAEKGSDLALLNIGDLYRDGQYVNKNPSEALKYYQKIIAKGNSKGMNRIASMYYVNKDTIKAFEWYNKAAQKNDALGLSWVGYMFLHGQGVKKDSTKARYYLEKALALGGTNAENILKDMNSHKKN